MAVIITKVDKPINVQAQLQSGGNLLPNTKYYVRVIGRTRDFTYYNYVSSGDMTTPPSDEISFTTDNTNKKAYITWNAVVGCIYYNVYCRAEGETYEGDWAGKKCGASVTNTCNTNSYTITDPAVGVGLDILGFLGKLPYKLSKESGMILVAFTGTVTLQDIADALDAAGLSNNYYYDSHCNFCMHGSIYQPAAGGVGYMFLTDHTIIMIHGCIASDNPSSIIRFGSGYYSDGTNGCVLCFCQYSAWPMSNLQIYNTVFKPMLVKQFYPNWYSGEEKIDSFNINMRGLSFIDMGISGFYTFNGMTFKAMGQNMSIYNPSIITNSKLHCNWLAFYNGGYIPASQSSFRDCEIRIGQPRGTTTYHFQTNNGDYGNIYYNDVKWFDCDFGYNYRDECFSWIETCGDPAKVKGHMFYNSVNLKIVGILGNVIQGVSVILKDKNGNIAYNHTSDVNGLVSGDILIMEARNKNGDGYGPNYTTLTEYGPFTMVVSKTGYKDYKDVIDIQSKIIWEISLDPPTYVTENIKGQASDYVLTGVVEEVPSISAVMSEVGISGVVEEIGINISILVDELTGNI
jgi:hypothetical protein